MDFNNQKLVRRQNYNSIDEADDRISELPDSLLHHIISFLDIKHAARTCLLSTRWSDIWKSIAILDFRFSWDHKEPPSLSEISKFMDFVDRTLLLHDLSSSIQKFFLNTHEYMNPSQVHSWICNITMRNVKELNLCLSLDKPFSIPVSLFRCQSLTKLELSASSNVHLPKSFSCPKLKILELRGIQFTDDNSWNERHFSNCPVLEYLILENCTWFGVSKFCISAPSLKVFKKFNGSSMGDGLQDCDLKICAPSLASLTYVGSVARDYDLTSFVALDDAAVYLKEYGDDNDDERWERWIGCGAIVTKLLRALSHVQSLIIDTERLQVISNADDFINNLPTFHNLDGLLLCDGSASEKLIFALLKATPNLKKLVFDDCTLSFIDDEKEYEETEFLCRHLQLVYFCTFIGGKEDLRLAELILRSATSLQTIISYIIAENKEVVMSQLSSLPRASDKY